MPMPEWYQTAGHLYGQGVQPSEIALQMGKGYTTVLLALHTQGISVRRELVTDRTWMSDQYCRMAHAAYARGDSDPEIIEGNQEYERRRKHSRREAADAGTS